MRHQNRGKWAQQQKKRSKLDPLSREAMGEQLRTRAELLRKQVIPGLLGLCMIRQRLILWRASI